MSPTIRLERIDGQHQRVHVDAAALRREVKEGGYTFADMNEYLRKYHGLRGFAMTDIARVGGSVIVDIRHVGLRERFLIWLKGL